MGNPFSVEVVVALVGAGASLVAVITAVFHAALYIGRQSVRLDGHDLQLRDHERRVKRLEAIAQ